MAALLLLFTSLALAIGTGSGMLVAVPDFSGRWTAEPAAPGAPGGRGDMGSGWGSPLTITQDANRLTVEYAFIGRGDLQPPLKFVYALDGSETRNSVMMGRGVQVQRSRAAWDGEKLVITTLHSFDDPGTGKPATVEVKQTLSLDSSGALVVETTRGAVLGGQPSTTRTLYKKS